MGNHKVILVQGAHTVHAPILCPKQNVDFLKCLYVAIDMCVLIIHFQQYNKQQIKWTHLLALYEWDSGLKRTSPGLRMLHKISHEHLHLTPSLRMRVYLAAQVNKLFEQ